MTSSAASELPVPANPSTLHLARTQLIRLRAPSMFTTGFLALGATGRPANIAISASEERKHPCESICAAANTVTVVTEIDGIEVTGRDFLLRENIFNTPGKNRFQNLSLVFFQRLQSSWPTVA